MREGAITAKRVLASWNLVAAARPEVAQWLGLTSDQRERTQQVVDRMYSELEPIRRTMPLPVRPLWKQEGLFAVGRPSVAAELNLSPDQDVQVRKIVNATRDDLKRLIDAMYVGGQDDEGSRARERLKANGNLARMEARFPG